MEGFPEEITLEKENAKVAFCIRIKEQQEGGSGWGTHGNPWLIHVNVWQTPLQYYKVIRLQLIKINGKKKRIKEQQENVCVSAHLCRKRHRKERLKSDITSTGYIQRMG